MRKLLNTLYVSTQGLYLSREGETLLASLKGQKCAQFPLLNLENIVCFGNITISPFLLGACAEHGIGVAFHTEYGRFLARVQGPVHGNVLLRQRQYRAADNPEESLHFARSMVAAKLLNSRAVLQRFLRDHADKLDAVQADEVCSIILRLKMQVQLFRRAQNCDELRGIEGACANDYFSVFDYRITTQKEAFFFHTRNRRPPTDNVNALLSFVYMLLTHDVTSALESVGLDPAVGFMHAIRSGRNALALDLIEEFRAYFADRLVLSLINLRIVSGKGFKRSETGAVTMDDETRKAVINAYQERKQDVIIHPYLNEKIKLGLLPYAQALLLASAIRGDINAYPPFFAR